jgi:hypothetical protein
LNIYRLPTHVAYCKSSCLLPAFEADEYISFGEHVTFKKIKIS